MQTVLQYEFLTKVQEATYPTIAAGEDVLAKAKTGTGKTLGFLIPIVERMAREPATQRGVRALVLSPTRCACHLCAPRGWSRANTAFACTGSWRSRLPARRALC